MRWLYVLIGGLLDVCWAVGLKFTDGFTVLWPSVFTAVCMIVGYWMFARAMKLLPVGTAYAVFIGIGSAGTAVVGMLFLDEPVGLARIFFLMLLIGSILGLRFVADGDEQEG